MIKVGDVVHHTKFTYDEFRKIIKHYPPFRYRVIELDKTRAKLEWEDRSYGTFFVSVDNLCKIEELE